MENLPYEEIESLDFKDVSDKNTALLVLARLNNLVREQSELGVELEALMKSQAPETRAALTQVFNEILSSQASLSTEPMVDIDTSEEVFGTVESHELQGLLGQD